MQKNDALRTIQIIDFYDKTNLSIPIMVNFRDGWNIFEIITQNPYEIWAKIRYDYSKDCNKSIN
jgi:hypothetical protein